MGGANASGRGGCVGFFCPSSSVPASRKAVEDHTSGSDSGGGGKQQGSRLARPVGDPVYEALFPGEGTSLARPSVFLFLICT